MTSAASRDAVAKKKHVRFASMEDDDDNDEQEEDTLFDKRKDAGRGARGALKAAAKRAAKGGIDARVEVVGGGRGGTCGRWMVTLALCGSFLGLVKTRETAEHTGGGTHDRLVSVTRRQSEHV